MSAYYVTRSHIRLFQTKLMVRENLWQSLISKEAAKEIQSYSTKLKNSFFGIFEWPCRFSNIYLSNSGQGIFSILVKISKWNEFRKSEIFENFKKNA